MTQMTAFDLAIAITTVRDMGAMPKSGASVSALAVSSPLDTRGSREVRMA
ncbi:MAG: hypothetical protein FD173_1400 [Gallionellaceae bacterium]|nr:MAG: hypothetical protein FD173_1400 [Gallionellaceae bacterium]